MAFDMQIKVKFWDMLLLLGSIAVSFLPALLVFSMQGIPRGNLDERTAIISVSGVPVESLPLDRNGVFEFSFEDQVGYVEVANNRIRMLEMDKETCPEGICSDTGWIVRSFETIVCLPNRIVVHIKSAPNDVDMMAN